MNGPEPQLVAVVACLSPVLAAVLPAYGPAPGVELIPYFLGLLTWMGLAVAAVAWAPIAGLWRRLRGTRSAPADAPPERLPAVAPESRGNGSEPPV